MLVVDPGNSAVDVRRNSVGNASKASQIAQSVMTHGFGAHNPQDFAGKRAASTQEANNLRPCKPQGWVVDTPRHKKVKSSRKVIKSDATCHLSRLWLG